MKGMKGMNGNERGQQKETLNDWKSGCIAYVKDRTSVIKIIINKQVDDYCYHLHNHLHELMSLKRINHQ